jgi:hypothetical protein
MLVNPQCRAKVRLARSKKFVGILEADPNTDWSKIKIGALREHLIDVNEVELRAMANEHMLDNGLEGAARRGILCGKRRG